jgi:hypothetical protein
MTESSAAGMDIPTLEPQPPAREFRSGWSIAELLQHCWPGLVAALRSSVLEHFLAFSVLGVHVTLLLVAIAMGWVPGMFQPAFDFRYTLHLLYVAGRWLPILAVVVLVRARGRPRAAWVRLREDYMSAPRVLSVLVGALLVAQVAITHDRWKSLFGRLNPWSWDAKLAAADRLLHGGVDPWRLIHPVVGNYHLTVALDTAYWMWFVVIGFVLGWVLLTRRRQLRAQFLLAWVLMWVVLGTIMAHAFASGGPAFYAGLVDGQNPYSELMAALAAVHEREPLVALNLQSQVWDNAVAGGGMHWLSMSAMPSLHVAIAVLFALSMFRVHWLLGTVFWGFAAIIQLGSVYLGWHYALDGYVGAVGVLALWRLSGWATRERRPLDHGHACPY